MTTTANTEIEGGAHSPVPSSPRIYVACLVAYNAGRLHGRWIDADQPAEDIWSEVHAMLAGSPEPAAEEWAIHDYEGFGQLRLSEWESFERVAAIAVGITQHGDAFTAWLAYDSSLDPSDTTAFEDAYRGEWDSLHDYAEDFAESTGLYDAAEKAGSPYVTVDVDAFERDLDIELYTVTSDHHTVYVEAPVAATVGSNAECGRYLTALFADSPPDTFIELRLRVAHGMQCLYLPVADLAHVTSTVARRVPDTDVYVGVLPRRRRGGTRDAVVLSGAVLWADCDTPQSVAALAKFVPKPSMTVASGSGDNRHAYWLLDEPASIDVIEIANRRLADLLGADVSCVDPARILRPPSLNHRHDPPRRVRVLHSDPTCRHQLEDVVGDLRAERMPLARSHGVGMTHRVNDDALLRIEPAVYIERLAGLQVSRARKVSCPFHEDPTPSLHVYREPQRGWFCFGCRRGGSVYDFAALLWGRETRGADFLKLRAALSSSLGVHRQLWHV